MTPENCKKDPHFHQSDEMHNEFIKKSILFLHTKNKQAEKEFTETSTQNSLKKYPRLSLIKEVKDSLQ